MRVTGLLLLVLGVLAYVVPNYQDIMPFELPMPVGDLRIIAAVLVLLGLGLIFLGRRES